MNEFYRIINDVYFYINQNFTIDKKYKFIDYCKRKLKIPCECGFSSKYYSLIRESKKYGIVYTPKEIANFIIKNLIVEKNIINNPYIKILDPSCGCGNLMLECFKYLKDIYLKNIDKINKKNNIKLNYCDIEKHIVNFNLFGFDIDKIAIMILKIDLFRLSGNINEKNFIVKDFLIDRINEKFDFLIGNPPYIGHKSGDKNYFKILKKKYTDVYNGKGDILYCFFSKSIRCLGLGGKLSFIASRYFCESKSGGKLRKFIVQNTKVHKIVDFYGIRPFRYIGIDPIIMFLRKEKNIKENDIEIIRPKNNKLQDSNFFNYKERCTKFSILQSNLKENGWVFVNKIEENILKKIEKKAKILLSDICESHQGIITGCDKAFILDYTSIKKYNIELNVVKPWIKSSYIDKYSVIRTEKYIIYLNYVKNPDTYKNSIKFISRYKDKLENRRECKSGNRNWYELEWCRKPEIFEKEKIVFPYKSNSNKFAIDSGSYFSADIYCITLKRTDIFNYNDLLYILNSTVYEFYFKTFAKKLGQDVYEYYPSNLMKLKIPLLNFHFSNTDNNKYLYKFFEFTANEINVIESKCN
ncbi:adenine-specific DNA-methyltransferase [Clostridium algifaecis]|uniref:site-specific DNA-methyltransferase (adenine-specific) n=1 Tax=Clostridium algifaecis TaxID=1472040 RepID=A0ABS4KR02_9CLOT|nr:N-6 DNA methylase [Clostridium algifaecis]MBP2032477.1 adenine-specific DNA-methyltransferase [Clostridium algifaecis]